MIELTFTSMAEKVSKSVKRKIPSADRLVSVYSQSSLIEKSSFWFIFVIVLIALLAPVISPYDPAEQIPEDSLQGPSPTHPLGTDLFGRDILTRVIYGARISLLVGTVSVMIAMVIGVPLGSIAGYVGGWLDELIMRIIDMMMSIPALVLALAIIATFGSGVTNIIIIIGIVYSPSYARLIRGGVLSVKEEDYVKGAKSIGLGHPSILSKYVVPNAMTPVIVQATYHIATAIIIEASLSFLGLGVQPPTATWGIMIANGRGFLPDQWWISVFPGIAIFFTVITFNILGDALRDELDPRSQTEQEAGA